MSHFGIIGKFDPTHLQYQGAGDLSSCRNIGTCLSNPTAVTYKCRHGKFSLRNRSCSGNVLFSNHVSGPFHGKIRHLTLFIVCVCVWILTKLNKTLLKDMSCNEYYVGTRLKVANRRKWMCQLSVEWYRLTRGAHYHCCNMSAAYYELGSVHEVSLRGFLIWRSTFTCGVWIT